MARCPSCGFFNDGSQGHCYACGTKLPPCDDAPPSSRPRNGLDRLALLGRNLGFLGTLTAALVTLPFFWLSAGTEIRPMGWATLVFMIAGVTAIIGLPLSFVGLWSDHVSWAILGLLFALAPLPVSWGIMWLASIVAGFKMLP